MAFSAAGGRVVLLGRAADRLATAFAARAETEGIHLGAGTRFGLDGAFERNLRIPFALESTVLEDALLRIKPLWHALNPAAPSFKRSVV